MSKKQLTIECIAALIISLFLYAGVSKFAAFRTFADQLNNQPLPNSWTPFLVWTIPLLEIGISTALVFECSRLLGFVAAMVLMSLFTVYTALVLFHFFAYVPCSCGGVIQRLTWPQHLLLNLGFTTLSALGIKLQHRKLFKSIFITNKQTFV
ncbi:MAG TPA: MauE/DoxX family redox-associated membrane protein [Puia sp.]|nr:MauE/DoxX family redox-associated membrane protein [Puia sp.]